MRHKLRMVGIDPARHGRFNNSVFPGNGGTVDSVRPDADTVDDSVTIPDSAEALAELASDPARWNKVVKNGKALVDFIDKCSSARINHHKDVKAQVDEQIDRRWASFLKENALDGFAPVNLAPGGPRGPGMLTANTANAKAGLYNPQAMGSALDPEFKNSADFFSLIWHNRQRDSEDYARINRMRNAFTSNVPSEGGFLIPEQLRSQLLSVSLESSVVRNLAFVVPMETLRVPFPSIDSTSNANSVYGGIVAYWTEEGAALTESAAEFGRVVLDAKKLTALANVPNELISDSLISFQAFIDQKFPEAVSFYEDIAFMKGSGVGEPLGALKTDQPAMITVAAESGQTAGSIVWENIVKMYSRMLPMSMGRAVWVASIDTFPELATMALSVGTGGSAIWLNNGVEGPPMTILGRPVIFTEKTPATIGSQGDISFVDFGYYLVGDRQVMSATSSPHFKYGNDQTSFRIISRVDGRPWLQSPITPQNSGSTLSAFVQLATRS
jgi:HK97 family phage major capsid protein